MHFPRALVVLALSASPCLAQRAVFLVGEEEYGSERSMPLFADDLRAANWEVELRQGEGREMPDPPDVDEADLLVMFLRFREPSEAQLAKLDAWFDAGKPALALRTTSHLFWGDELKGWFPPRFGGHYKSHASNSAGTIAERAVDATGHPILSGIPARFEAGHGGTYNAQPLNDGATVILFGRTGELPSEPIAWTYEPAAGARRFYTSLGSLENFERTEFRQLLLNAAKWCVDPSSLGFVPDPAPLPEPPLRLVPEDAVSLWTGDSLEAWRHWDPSQEPRGMHIDERADTSSGGARYTHPRWRTAGPALIARPGFGDLLTQDDFGEYHLHLDFLLPHVGAESGVYVAGRWEVPLGDVEAGVWHSLDVTYEQRAGDVAHLSAWIDDARVLADAAFEQSTIAGFLEPMRGATGPGEGERYVSDDEELDWSLPSFAVTSRFRTRAGGTLASKCPPEGNWAPDAKALFLRGGRVVYDIGWVGALQSKGHFNDGEWHRVVLTSDDGHARMYIDGALEAENEEFEAEDHDEFAFKVGAANPDFAGVYSGDIADVRFYDRRLSPTEARALSGGEEPELEPAFEWEPEPGSAPIASGEVLEGPIRLQADNAAVRFANIWVQPLEDVDHVSIIEEWGDASLARGRETYASVCVACHGADGTRPTNPKARPFATGELMNGSDPLRLYHTIQNGFQEMPSNEWLTPERTYDVIHFLREEFLRERNAAQYYAVDDAYLSSLPKGRRHGGGAGSGDELPPRDFGPALASQLGDDVGACLTVRLDDATSIAYDLQMMESPAAWTGFLDLEQTQHYQQRGEGRARPKGERFDGLDEYGWGHEGSLDYDRTQRPERGPLPRKWLDYHGHYLHERSVVLSYAIDGRDVLEQPGVDRSTSLPVLTHRLHVAPGETELVLQLGHAPTDGAELWRQGAGPAGGVLPWSVCAFGVPAEAGLADFAGVALLGEGTIEVDAQQRMFLNVPPSREALEYYILRYASPFGDELEGFELVVRNFAERELPASPTALIAGGPARWPDVLRTSGSLGHEEPYALDTLDLPAENPWNAWIRTSALDFFDDGRAAVATHGGDVWIVSGIDAELEHLSWRRFAAGMFEPMGVRIVDGEVYVTCRDRITRLHDTNADGEADFYESFFADPDVSPNFHAFNFDLQTDAEGSFFYAKSGQYTDFALPGAILKVAADGQSYSVYCTGLRTPNGMGMSPNGRPLVSDNQGNWVPASKVSLTSAGGFYGVFKAINTNGPGKQTRDDFDPPAVWMPQGLDSSSGGQLWIDDERFGPLAGRYLHTSFGKGWMYPLVIDEVAGHPQGAVWRMPFQFAAGIQRLRVNPSDGQVYAVGLSGWQGPPGGADGALQRVRYTGGDKPLLISAHARSSGVELVFSAPIDTALAGDPRQYTARRWNYRWTRDYGSAHYSLLDPEREGEDRVPVSAVTVADDGFSVLVELADMRPCHQLVVMFECAAQDGTPLNHEVFFTVNALPQ